MSLNESVSGEDCLRLAAPMASYWHMRNKHREGRKQLEAAHSKTGVETISLDLAAVFLRLLHE